MERENAAKQLEQLIPKLEEGRVIPLDIEKVREMQENLQGRHSQMAEMITKHNIQYLTEIAEKHSFYVQNQIPRELLMQAVSIAKEVYQ